MASKAAIVPTEHYPFPGEAQQAITPMELMQLALSKGTDITQLEKLMDLQDRWEKKEAQKAYVSAMNAFKAEPPDIHKNRSVAYTTSKGDVSYMHATLDEVCDKVTAGLSKHGISHRWRVKQSGPRIEVTCILTHERGHSEETTLESSADDTGSKNAIQAIGSAVTYLQRYTLLAATGLAASNGDNDGQGTPEWSKLQEYLDSMSTAPNLTVLDMTFKAAFKEAMTAKNTKALLTLATAKDNRKKVLQQEMR